MATKVLPEDYRELLDLKNYLSKNNSFRVESLTKERVGQRILDNKFFHDFNLDGVIDKDDFTIAWNWVMLGKPNDITKFNRDMGGIVRCGKLPYQYIQDDDVELVDGQLLPTSLTLPVDNRTPSAKELSGDIDLPDEMTSDWDGDGEVDELEAKILERFILTRPKTVDEYNRNRGDYPKVKVLPTLETAKYSTLNPGQIEWTDLIVFREWLRLDKPMTRSEFNDNSTSEVPEINAQYVIKLHVALGNDTYSTIPITDGVDFIPVRAYFIIIDAYAGKVLHAILTYLDEALTPYDSASGPNPNPGEGASDFLGVATGSASLYPSGMPQNAFDGNATIGATEGRWLAFQALLPYVYIQYQFLDPRTNAMVSHKVAKYTIMSDHETPAPLNWKLQGATLEGLSQAGGAGETGWVDIHEVNEQTDPYPRKLMTTVSAVGSGIVTGSTSHSSHPAENAFDGAKTPDSSTGRWFAYQSDLPDVYVQYQFHNMNKHTVSSYTVMSQHQNATKRSPKSWKLQGINTVTLMTSGEWTDVDVVLDEPTWDEDETRTYQVDNPGEYEYYRFLITEAGGSDKYVALREIELYSPNEDLPWEPDETRTYQVTTPGEYEYYRISITDAWSESSFVGAREIQLLVITANTRLPYVPNDQEGYWYGCPYPFIKKVTIGGLTLPDPYESIGSGVQTFDHVYVGEENL